MDKTVLIKSISQCFATAGEVVSKDDIFMFDDDLTVAIESEFDPDASRYVVYVTFTRDDIDLDDKLMEITSDDEDVISNAADKILLTIDNLL